MKEFELKKEKWLKEVVEGCHNLASQYSEGPDFYVFQSKLSEQSPELLIVGANPGRAARYIDKLREKGIERRSVEDLGYSTNQYIENENNEEWKINKPILKMFTDVDARKALEDSVIMNVVYFNTRKVNDLKKIPNGKEMIEFCVKKTQEFIYDILKPKNVLFLGVDAPKWLHINFDKNSDTVLETEDGLFLVKLKKLNNINHLLIYHPSINQKFNSGKNLELKKDFFNQYFKK